MISITRKLNNGLDIPLIGLGSNLRISVDIVYNSIKSGVRLIDTAYRYKNEIEIGKGIKKAIDEEICKREDLIIIGKVWTRYRTDPEKALKQTLQNLQLDYIDIYIDHWPTGKDYRNKNDKFEMISVYDFWPKMEKLVDDRLARSLGVSNYNIQCLCNLLSFCKIKPVVNEVEYHLFYIQKSLKEFCEKQNIAVIAYYPMPRGNGAREYIKEHPEFDILEDEMINDLAKKYDKTPGQIILNWHYCIGTIPIPSTSKLDRMSENLKSLEFKMKDEDIEKLSKNFKQMSLKKFCGCIRFFGINILA